MMFVLFSICDVGSAEPTGRFILDVDSSSVILGQNATVNVKANFSSIPDNDGIIAYQTTINYDANVFEFVSFDKTVGAFENFLDNPMLLEPGKIQLTGIALYASGAVRVINGMDMPVVKLFLKAKSSAPLGRSTVALMNVEPVYISLFAITDNVERTPVLDSRGEITVNPIPTGSLRLNLVPGNATWTISGDTKKSGEIFTVSFPTGDKVTKRVTFSDAPGYFTPAPRDYEIVKDVPKSEDVQYTEKGKIKVTITNPPEAKWKLNGVLHNSGEEVSNLDSGDYYISFTDVDGYTTPGTLLKVVSPTAAPGGNTHDLPPVDYTAWGTVTAVIEPNGLAGAGWYLDAASDDVYASGETSKRVVSGSHDVHFIPVAGYTTPSPQSVTVSDSNDVALKGTYIEKSTLVVVLSQDKPLPTARWSVNGQSYAMDTGVSLDAGTYQVSFTAPDGYLTPPSRNVIVPVTPKTKTELVTFAEEGSITVTITEPAGARWYLDGTPKNSGDTVSGLQQGNYTISFSAVQGYITPANVQCLVSETAKPGDNTYVISRDYKLGAVQTTITPDAAVAAGAKWYLDGNSNDLKDSGKEVSVSAGTHDVYFTEVSGFTTPAKKQITIASAAPVQVLGEYVAKGSLTFSFTPDEVSDKARWILNNTEYKSGEKVALDANTYEIAFTPVEGYKTPNSVKAKVEPGKDAALTAAYTKNSSGGGGGGGGCSAGFAVLALLSVIPLSLRKKR